MPVLDLESGQFHYHIDDFSDPWRRGEPVLLHHAAGGNLHRWRPWVPTLSRHHPVVRFDMRGHAGTPPPPDLQFSLPDLAADIARVMDGLSLDRCISSARPQEVSSASSLRTTFRTACTA